MPNCDWGRPCDCKDCRTTYEKVACPNCGFQKTISIVRDTIGFSTDNKGIGGYEFANPKNSLENINCEKCGHSLKHK
jgi:predicted RNA-binding Zn-ribbon protein involved in translation (DUF1610 family)